jgi:hypothetical protein
MSCPSLGATLSISSRPHSRQAHVAGSPQVSAETSLCISHVFAAEVFLKPQQGIWLRHVVAHTLISTTSIMLQEMREAASAAVDTITEEQAEVPYIHCFVLPSDLLL